ncbi:IS66 family insertion sequence element accessory protein TnpB [bacterium]|nr:IS66 family insertion sequence element accessory protein TnpB [bacterium]
MRILLSVEPIDFRKGIDSLVSLCRDVYHTDPFAGIVFVFMNRRRTSLKILLYDGQGFWLCLKRLSQGRYRRWFRADGRPLRSLAAHELQAVLVNGNPVGLQAAPAWRQITPEKGG